MSRKLSSVVDYPAKKLIFIIPFCSIAVDKSWIKKPQPRGALRARVGWGEEVSLHDWGIVGAGDTQLTAIHQNEAGGVKFPQHFVVEAGDECAHLHKLLWAWRAFDNHDDGDQPSVLFDMRVIVLIAQVIGAAGIAGVIGAGNHRISFMVLHLEDGEIVASLRPSIRCNNGQLREEALAEVQHVVWAHRDAVITNAGVLNTDTPVSRATTNAVGVKLGADQLAGHKADERGIHASLTLAVKFCVVNKWVVLHDSPPKIKELHSLGWASRQNTYYLIITHDGYLVKNIVQFMEYFH